MKRAKKKLMCVSCGAEVSSDAAGLNMKLLGTDGMECYCMECLAGCLDCDVADLEAKLADFREAGCKLFD